MGTAGGKYMQVVNKLEMSRAQLSLNGEPEVPSEHPDRQTVHGLCGQGEPGC